MTTIANASNIHTLLTELQQYVKSPNKDFVAATIQAIARCATTVPTASDKCLGLLMKLLGSKNGKFYNCYYFGFLLIGIFFFFWGDD